MTVIGFTIAMLLVLALAGWSVHLQEVEQENAAKEAYLTAAGELYEVLDKRIEQKRKYRHDLLKHIRTLDALMERQEKWETRRSEGVQKEKQQTEVLPLEGLQTYLAELKAQHDALLQDRLCKDDLVDAVLSVKRQQCQERSIHLEVDVQDVMYSEILDLDLVGILENLLDNALEAQERITDASQRWVRLTMGRRNGQIRIVVENRIDGEVRVDFQTRKPHPEEHGLGLRIVDQLAEKYQGRRRVSVDQEHGLYQTEVCLRAAEARPNGLGQW